MKLSLAPLAACAALLSPALADFELYMVDQSDLYDVGVYWQVFETRRHDCDQVLSQPTWLAMRDVSGNKEGIRCVGSGCSFHGQVANIDVLEMNFHAGAGNVLHWTLYKDRDWTMVGLDGNTYGNCIPFPYGDYSCGGGRDDLFRMGYRKFRCLTNFTAADLNNA